MLQLPAGCSIRRRRSKSSYERLGEPNIERRAIARVFTLPGNFHLLIGDDLEDRERLRHISIGLVHSLLWLLGIATFGSCSSRGVCCSG